MTANAQRTYLYYRCQSYYQRSKSCQHNKQASEAKIEAYLLEHLRQDMNDYLIKQYELEQTRPKRPINDKAKVKAKLGRLKELYVDGLIDKAEYMADHDMYVKQLETIEKECADIELPINIEHIKTLLESDFKAVYEHLTSPEDKQAFWRSIIREIRLDNDNNVVDIKYV